MDFDQEIWDEFGFEDDDVDIEATVEALREAWKLVPTASLYELLDLATHMPFMELSNHELIECLNNFIHQNQ